MARALVKDAGVLLFDDSFSALDVKTDAALRRALREQVVRPAKLIVAQRVSTILDADLILVLDEGRLVGAKHPRGVCWRPAQSTGPSRTVRCRERGREYGTQKENRKAGALP
ncbi:MAG: hypothetical protein ACLRNQ_23425 [Flavonifractor plautii]